jgi:hypothetical protein
MKPRTLLSCFVLAAAAGSASALAAERIVPIIVLGEAESELAPHLTAYLPAIITGMNKSGPFVAVFDPNFTSLSPEDLPASLFTDDLEGCGAEESYWCWPSRRDTLYYQTARGYVSSLMAAGPAG